MLFHSGSKRADETGDAVGACLEPVHARTFGDDAHMRTHFFWQVLYHRLQFFWFNTTSDPFYADVQPAAVGGSARASRKDEMISDEGLRLFHAPHRQLSQHEMRFMVAFYVYLAAWVLYCAAARSWPCIALGAVLSLAPIWYAIFVVVVYGNPDDFHVSDHLGVMVEFDLKDACADVH